MTWDTFYTGTDEQTDRWDHWEQLVVVLPGLARAGSGRRLPIGQSRYRQLPSISCDGDDYFWVIRFGYYFAEWVLLHELPDLHCHIKSFQTINWVINPLPSYYKLEPDFSQYWARSPVPSLLPKVIPFVCDGLYSNVYSVRVNEDTDGAQVIKCWDSLYGVVTFMKGLNEPMLDSKAPCPMPQDP